MQSEPGREQARPRVHRWVNVHRRIRIVVTKVPSPLGPKGRHMPFLSTLPTRAWIPRLRNPLAWEGFRLSLTEDHEVHRRLSAEDCAPFVRANCSPSQKWIYQSPIHFRSHSSSEQRTLQPLLRHLILATSPCCDISWTPTSTHPCSMTRTYVAYTPLPIASSQVC